MSDIDMKLIGLYKFEIYYNEQDGEIEHGHNPYTFVILADSMDRLAYGIAQRERDWSMVGRRMYFDIATFIHVKAPDGIRLYDYDDFEISIIGGADFTDMHYAVYLTDEENPMNVSDDPDTYTKLVDAVSALYSRTITCNSSLIRSLQKLCTTLVQFRVRSSSGRSTTTTRRKSSAFTQTSISSIFTCVTCRGLR